MFYTLAKVMKKAVTINDIAEALGLSRNTVSKALNGQHVPQKTREIVLKKAQQMNYKSFDSGILKSKKYHILLLSGKPFHNMDFFNPIVNSIQNYCYENNFDFFEYTYNSSSATFDQIKAYIRNLNIDGIVAIECFDADFINKLLALKTPVCFLDFPGYRFDTKDKFDLIYSTDQKSACDYIKSLINQYGIKHFTFVGDYRHCLSFHERYMGLLRGVDRSGVTHHSSEDILDKDEEFDYGSVEMLKERISKLHKMPDCFVCCNDFVGRNTADALLEMGYKIPQDVLLFSFDGVNAAVNRAPLLTTFSLNKEFIGQETIRTLVSRIERKDTPTRIIALEYDLVVRESTSR